MNEATLTHLCQDALDAGDIEQAQHFGRLLDQLGAPKPLPPIGSAALWYAEQGLSVFPLQRGSKIPLTGSRGCKDATTDAEQIRRWWSTDPLYNVAIATGHLVDVIDVDGPEGVKSWVGMMEQLPPIIGTVSTPRPGGSHLYIAATGEGNRAAWAAGVDFRGVGGYVVAPPSTNAVGLNYYWRRPLQVALLGGSAAAA